MILDGFARNWKKPLGRDYFNGDLTDVICHPFNFRPV